MKTMNDSAIFKSLFFEQTTDAIFVINRDQEIICQNEAAADLLVETKLDVNEVLEFCLVCCGCTSGSEERTCENCLIKQFREEESFQIYLSDRINGKVPYSASFKVLDKKQQIGALSIRNLTSQQETTRAVEQSKLTKYVMNAHEEERKRMSRELHDGIAQELYSALIEVRKLKYIEKGDSFTEQMEDTENYIATILDDIRNMAVDLRPSALDDLGLYSALRSYCKRYEQNFGVEVAFISDIKHERFNPTVETVLYRVAQEALINAAKYADIEEVIVMLRKNENQLTLEIIDDGCGFEIEAMEIKGTGLGIMNMKERVELCGGTCEIKSKPGKGTEIIVNVQTG